MKYFEIIFTAVLVSATIVYVYYTYKLVVEARKSREIGLKPYMILYIDSSEASPTNRYLNIKNVGQGVAQNVRFKILKDIEIGSEYDVSIESKRFLNNTYSKFPPNYNFRHYIFNMANNPESKFLDYIEIECTYEDIFEETFNEKFKLSFKDSFASGRISPPDNYIGQIAYNLEKINKNLDKLNSKLNEQEN